MKKNREGSGIVCGLQLKRIGDKSVKINAGWGYTSTGRRIGIDESCEHVYYRHHRRENAREPELFDYFTGVNELFELLQTHQCGPETEDYNWIPRQRSRDKDYLDLNEKAVVVFQWDDKEPRVFAIHRHELATYLYGEIPWADINCGKQSRGENFSLWEKAPTNAAASVSDACLYNYLYPVMALPVIRVRRFGYGSIDFDELGCDDNYTSLCSNENEPYSHETLVQEYERIVDVSLPQLTDAFEAFHQYKKTRKWIGKEAIRILALQSAALTEKWESYKTWPLLNINSTVNGGDKSAIQYWYSFVRDLADAWNELRDTAAYHKGICHVSRKSYPNHLVLGTLPEERPPFYYQVFRTVFQQSSVKSGEAEVLQRLRFLHWRLVIMIKSFFVPGSDWDDTASDSYLNALTNRNSDNPEEIAAKISLPLRLTPSRTPDQPLGKRTIPFYFDLADHPQSLHWYWDYQAAFANTTGYLNSYHSDNEAAHLNTGGYAGSRSNSYTTHPEAIHPFAFDIRGLSFIRVEGLTGKVFEKKAGAFPDIVDLLKVLKERYCIAFTVIIKETGVEKLDCRRGIDHLGGVYNRGEFIVLVAPLAGAASMYRVVGDFTLLP